MLYSLQKGKYVELNPLHLSLPVLKALASATSLRILEALSKGESYPLRLAKDLKIDMQQVYYFIRKQERAGLIKKMRQEIKNGVVVNYYRAISNSYYLSFLPHYSSSKDELDFLSPFVQDAYLNASIIIGSPDPHGPEMARSRDGYYGIDLALFLGSYVSDFRKEAVKLDVEVPKEQLSGNLILIGGPIVNKVTAKFNEFLPIRFEARKNWAIYSSLSKKFYDADSAGILVKCKNPLGAGSILLLAGKKSIGTKVVIQALTQSLEGFAKGNKFDKDVHAHVVLGKDLDSDGVVDSFEILE